MFKLILVTAIHLWVCSVLAQSLQENFQILEENTGTVTGKKNVYEQQFNADSENPFMVSVKITDTGNGEQTIKTVNLQDLNPSRIVFEPKRDMVEISARVKADKRLVKMVENGQTQNYHNEFVFYAAGIEEARALADALESSVEIAEKELEPSASESLNKQQLLDYLSGSTEQVAIDDEIYRQELSFDTENNNIIKVEIEDLAKGTKEEYQVNASDLYLTKIDFDTRRNQVFVGLTTKADAKLISYVKDGEIGNFTNGFEILMPSIEQARTYSSNLKQLVKIAESEETTAYDSYTAEQCRQFLTDNIGQVVINQDSYRQSYSVDPDNPLILQITSSDISKGLDHTFSVNAGYLHKGQTQFDTRGNAVMLAVETDGNRKLISTREGEEATNYTNSIVVRAQDIEQARALSAVFTRYKELARQQMEEESPFANADQAEKYIEESVGKLVINTDTYIQSVKVDPENSCLYTYEFTDVSRDVQYDYEFNFQDIDHHKTQFDTKGVQAFVSMEIRGKNKLVKTYKDGEVDKYVYNLEILAPDIEQARMLVAALKLKAESCQK